MARERAVSAVVSRLGLTEPGAADTLGEAHDVVWEHLGPFVVGVANDMVEDLRAEVAGNPARRIVFLGRDGHSLAIAARALDPELFDRHCSEVVLSRVVVESALQDLERNSGRSFPEISDFRGVAAKVSEDDVSGARARLSDYLQRSGVPVGEPGSEVTLVDTSFKGTIQECLAAIYPETTFAGRYVFFGASAEDPHPGSKRGYALHLEAPRSNGGRPVPELDDDPRLTFACQDSVGAVEETLNGSLPSPGRISGGRPVQDPSDPGLTAAEGLNPLRVADRYRDPAVRRAVKQLNLVAVKQYADAVVEARARGGIATDPGVERAGELRSQLRRWIRRDDPDPRLARMLDSFVRRSDKDTVRRLSEAMRSSGLASDQVRAVWTQYDMQATLEEKKSFVERVVRQADAGPRRTEIAGPQRRLGPAGSHRRVPSRSPVPRGGSDRGPGR